MSEEMKFPDTLDEFIKQYSFIDKEQIYTNGSELIHTFRVKQWEEHKKQENQELKNELKEANDSITWWSNRFKAINKENQELKNKLSNSHQMKNSQKEFIEYMNKTIKELECDDVDDEEMKGYLIQSRNTFKEILSKFKEIMGYDE